MSRLLRRESRLYARSPSPAPPKAVPIQPANLSDYLANRDSRPPSHRTTSITPAMVSSRSNGPGGCLPAYSTRSLVLDQQIGLSCKIHVDTHPPRASPPPIAERQRRRNRPDAGRPLPRRTAHSRPLAPQDHRGIQSNSAAYAALAVVKRVYSFEGASAVASTAMLCDPRYQEVTVQSARSADLS